MAKEHIMRNSTHFFTCGFSCILIIIFVFSVSVDAFAGSRADLVINLGGGFVDNWTPGNAKETGSVADYATSAPVDTHGNSDGSFQIQIFETGQSFPQKDAKKFYIEYKATIMSGNIIGSSLQPFSAGDEAVYAKGNSNKDSTVYVGRIGKYLVAMYAYDPKNKMGKHFTDIMARLSGKPAAGKYSQLIAILKKYKPLLFKDIPDEVIVKALDTKRTGIVGPGATIDLEQNMMKEIQAFTKMLDTPLTGSKSLVSSNEKTYDFKDDVWELLAAIKNLLPEATRKLMGVANFFVVAHKYMATVKDAYVIPAVAENLYSIYKSHRGPGSDQTSETVYDTWVSKSGTAMGQVRSSSCYKALSGDEFNRVFREHLEARYQLELYEETRREMIRDRERIIEKIVGKYDTSINSVHSACEELMK